MSDSPEGYWNRLGILWLWIGVLSGPLVWALDLGISYAMVKWACAAQGTGALHLVSAAAVALVCGGAILSWWCYRQLPEASLDGAHVSQRSRFLAVLGLSLNGLFLLVIVATAIPRFVLSPCQ